MRVRELAEAVIEGGLEVGDLRLELGELGGEGEVLLLDEGAVLLRVDVSSVGLGADGVELVEEAADKGVGLGGDGGGVAGAPRELLVREKEGHRFQECRCPNRRVLNE